MYKRIFYLLVFCILLGACSFKIQQKDVGINTFSAIGKNFARASSVFKIDLDEKLGEGSSLLLSIDYDEPNNFYNIKILGAFASVLLKAKYQENNFYYDFKPELLENKQVQELFEQTIKVLISDDYSSKYDCKIKQCTLSLGTQMFKNNYTFEAYNKEGFAQNILCSYRRGVIKINLHLLKIK